MASDSILLSEITNYNLRRRLSTLAQQDIELQAKISILKKDRQPTSKEIQEIFEKLNLKHIQKPDTSESNPDGWKASYQQRVSSSLNKKKLLSLELYCPCCKKLLKGENKIITPAVLEEATDVSISKPFVKIVPSKKEEESDNEE